MGELISGIVIGVTITGVFLVLTILIQMLSNYLDHIYAKTRIKDSAILKEKITCLKIMDTCLEESTRKLFFLAKEFIKTKGNANLVSIAKKIKIEASHQDETYSMTSLSIFKSKKIFDEYIEYWDIINEMSKFEKHLKEKNANIMELKITLNKIRNDLISKKTIIIKEMKREIGL